jgi:hypothetical protein
MESEWMQTKTVFWIVAFIGLNEINQINQINYANQKDPTTVCLCRMNEAV